MNKLHFAAIAGAVTMGTMLALSLVKRKESAKVESMPPKEDEKSTEVESKVEEETNVVKNQETDSGKSTTPTPTGPAKMTASKCFNSQWAKQEKKVEFNPKWKNGTGHLDFAKITEIKELEDGEFGAGEDDVKRKFIIYRQSKNRNWIIFERFSDPSNVILFNVPFKPSDWDTNLSIENIEKFMQGAYFNLPAPDSDSKKDISE